jgi:hypothetical protein
VGAGCRGRHCRGRFSTALKVSARWQTYESLWPMMEIAGMTSFLGCRQFNSPSCHIRDLLWFTSHVQSCSLNHGGTFHFMRLDHAKMIEWEIPCDTYNTELSLQYRWVRNSHQAKSRRSETPLFQASDDVHLSEDVGSDGMRLKRNRRVPLQWG